MPKRNVVREDGAPASVSAEELTRAHGAYLRSLAAKLCRSQLDPDDLVQDVLEKTLRHPVPDGVNARAWLARVMQNLFIDKLRRQHARREDAMHGDAPEAERLDEPVWWQHLDEAAVRAQLARLPEEQRTTFELFAFEGRSYDEIAARLRIAKATVGTRILRARQKLRELLTTERGNG